MTILALCFIWSSVAKHCDLASLDDDFSKREVVDDIVQIPKYKFPGLDGFTQAMLVDYQGRHGSDKSFLKPPR
jgi:hypothetical protein